MIKGLADSQWQAVEAGYEAIGPARIRFCPHQPTAKQEAFLLVDAFEALFGGAAGGGKTVALGIAALQYADVPGYHALLLRPSLVEFQLPGGLMQLLTDWLAGTKASWSGDKNAFLFPGPGKLAGSGGASVGFGFLDSLADVGRYSGTSYSFLGFDELVRYDEIQYRRMLRVLRQPGSDARLPAAPDGLTLAQVPVRVRSTSNPGGPNHGWVKTRFVDPNTRKPDIVFLASRLEDNPHLDQATYLRTLDELPGAERWRLLRGDWDVADEGELFQQDWFPILDRNELPQMTHAVRYWDLAGTEPSIANTDPDYTVGLKLETDAQGCFYVTDIIRVRKAPGAIEQLVADTAKHDGRYVAIVLEQEPGASGVALIDHYIRNVLPGYTVKGNRVTGPKQIRAQPVAAAAEHGLVKLVRGRNLLEFLDELCGFPHAPHDDTVDALSGAHHVITKQGGQLRTYVPQGHINDYIPRDRLNRPRTAQDTLRRLEHANRHTANLAASVGIPWHDSRYASP